MNIVERTMKKTITGLLELSRGILCKREALGCVYNARIAGIDVLIHFPQFPPRDGWEDDVVMPPLLPPTIGSTWKKGEESLQWGHIRRYPSGESYVELLALSIECESNEVNECAEKIYGSITKWEQAFIDYLMLETKQNTERDENITRKTCGLELMADEYIPQNKTILIHVSIPTPDNFASADTLQRAITYAESGKELLLEYQMLLSSYEARRNSRNRQAVIDACSAAEICLEKNIQNCFQAIGLDGDFFLKKYRSLGDRFGLIKQLDPHWGNTDYQKLVVNPRNSVAHNSIEPVSDETTDTLIRCVEECLDHFFYGYYIP